MINDDTLTTTENYLAEAGGETPENFPGYRYILKIWGISEESHRGREF